MMERCGVSAGGKVVGQDLLIVFQIKPWRVF
jgi:hypothetical protein